MFSLIRIRIRKDAKASVISVEILILHLQFHSPLQDKLVTVAAIRTLAFSIIQELSL